MLDICKSFFDRLNDQDVRYCHWKSNSHLAAALEGQTDLDVLVHPDDRLVFEHEMSSADFKRILSPPEKQFPGFEDYLGFDHKTGKFVHLHVHYRLIMGRKYIKNHYLPIEPLYFENLTKKSGVKIPRPELELIMLIMRAHLKADYLSILKHAIKNAMGATYTAFPGDIENEIRELAAESNAENFLRLLKATGLPLDHQWCDTFLNRFSSEKLRWHHIWYGHYLIRRQLKTYRRNTGITVPLNYFRQFLLSTRLANLLLKARKKTLPDGGRVISIIGADGSGKSTLIGDINKWLSWKLTTTQYYYGIPKDLVRDVGEFFMRAFGKLRLNWLARTTENLFWLHVGRARQLVSKRTEDDVRQGYVVVTDRFPLKDFHGMLEPMDNPRIDPMARMFGKNLRELEDSFYLNLRCPDLAVVLQVNIEELRRRKTDISHEMHVKKANAVNSIEPRDKLVTINANRPYEEVLLEVKRHIWRAI